jgi:hypothetical protein
MGVKGCVKRMYSREKPGGNLCEQSAQAAPDASSENLRKIVEPEECG